MAYTGFAKPKYCTITIAAEPSGAGKETLGELKVFAKAISINAAFTTANTKLYADNGVAEYANEFTGGTVTLNVDDTEPAVDADIIGATIDEATDISDSIGDEGKYLRFGYLVRRLRGGKAQYRGIIYYKIKLGLPPDAYETKGETVTFKTPTFTGELMANVDGLWRKRSAWKDTAAEAETWLDTELVKQPAPAL